MISICKSKKHELMQTCVGYVFDNLVLVEYIYLL